MDTVAFAPKGQGARAGRAIGRFAGIVQRRKVRIRRAWTSCSNEGNAFEADVVKGVEDAADADEGEVRTHEVPQDDVPGEYLDKEVVSEQVMPGTERFR